MKKTLALFALSILLCPGAFGDTVQGRVTGVTTLLSVIWNGYTAPTGNPFAAPGAVELVSTSAFDTADVRVTGYEVDSGVTFKDDVTLTGTTPTPTLRGGVDVFVNRLEYRGSSANAGTISARRPGLGGAVVSQIDVGQVSSESAFWSNGDDREIIIRTLAVSTSGLTGLYGTVTWWTRTRGGAEGEWRRLVSMAVSTDANRFAKLEKLDIAIPRQWEIKASWEDATVLGNPQVVTASMTFKIRRLR